MIGASTRLSGTDLDFHPLGELPKAGLPDATGLPMTVKVLLEGLLRPLNVGDHFPVTFHFQHAGDLTVSVPVVAASAA